MNDQLEILLYRYKWQNGLDVYSPLPARHMDRFTTKLYLETMRLNNIAVAKNEGIVK